MKLVSTALLAAGLVALSACGGADEADNAAADATTDVNVAADDLTVTDNQLLGNETIGNDTGNTADDTGDGAGNGQ